MKIEQIYTGCLAQGSYYIESNGEAAVIDPLREVDAYIEKAKSGGAKIKYIFETHFHADFVSGHLTLAENTGASIVYGPGATTGFKITNAMDGQIFPLGNIQIKALHTPGHTLESLSFLVINENGKETTLFSGDTLFLGDVGRPDLAQKTNEITQEDLAGMLFDSLRKKIMPLSDTVVIYPGHGAGSACGKHMSNETIGTLGHEKRTNYALRADMTKAEFIQEVLFGLANPPAYFPQMVQLNKQGYDAIDKVMERNLNPLQVDEFEKIIHTPDTVILDVRTVDEFAKGFIPTSIFVGIDGGFAPWVGAVLKDVNKKIVLISPKGREKEVITRLSRVGFDQVQGYLDGGFEAWKNAGKQVDTISCISANELETACEKKDAKIIDVRKNGEFDTCHVVNATCLPLDTIDREMDLFPKHDSFYIHCAGGYRSMIACSLLKREGKDNMINVNGGFGAIQQTSMELVR